MATRTINFLPKIFQTDHNKKFLNATLDQLTTEPNVARINGYVGHNTSPAHTTGDNYLIEPTLTRQQYQLEPSVVVKETGKDAFVANYNDIVDAIGFAGGVNLDHDRLFSNQYYSYDGQFDFDKFVNHSQYYWLANGLDSVNVTGAGVATAGDYGFARIDVDSAYKVTDYEQLNPTLVLARGGTYNFTVDQIGYPFYIQAAAGTSGEYSFQSNTSAREVYGVTNNGEEQGTVTFQVPHKTAQDWILQLNDQDDINYATTLTYAQIQGQKVENFITNYGGIDGVPDLRNKIIIFVNNSTNESDWTDPNDPSTVIPHVSRTGTFIVRIDDSVPEPTLYVEPWVQVQINNKIKVLGGNTYGYRYFYKNPVGGALELLPPITANLDTLYYQDTTNPDMLGLIKLVDVLSNTPIDVERDILNKPEYTSPNGVVFTNGLKVHFDTTATPLSYQLNEYYVEGIGDAIRLVPVSELITPELYITSTLSPWDDVKWDSNSWDPTSSGPTQLDYITINRASRDRNAWSRSNRWFHIDTINATAKYNNYTPTIDQNTNAKRPIIEFNYDLQLFNGGRVFKTAIDVFDTVTTDAFSNIEGSSGYTVDGIDLTAGMLIVFAAETDENVVNKVYKVSIVDPSGDGSSITHLTLVEHAEVLANECLIVKFGTISQGKMVWFDGTTWYGTPYNPAQQKTKVNQAPLFDIFDDGGISYSDDSKYPSSDFEGNKIFSYRVGTGKIDSNLGFPLSYKSIQNIGDIVFDNNFDGEAFTYVLDGVTQTLELDGGKLHINNSLTYYIEKTAWILVGEESKQYQHFEYVATDAQTEFLVYNFGDSSNYVNNLKFYVNNKIVSSTNYAYEIIKDKRYIVLDAGLSTGDKVDIFVFANNQTLPDSYYQIPKNLEVNPLNQKSTMFTLGQLRRHIGEIYETSKQVSGSYLGSSNLRDLPKIKNIGGTILQHSASMIPVGLFLAHPDLNAVEAIQNASREYSRFKNKILDQAMKLDFTAEDSARYMLDQILAEINAVKTKDFAWYYSDMLSYGNDSVANTTTVTIENDAQLEYDLYTSFDLTAPSRTSVYVYVNDQQLVHGKDYVFLTVRPAIKLTAGIIATDDILTIIEYSTSDGSYIPETPSKMGLWPSYQPRLYTDYTFVEPTLCIEGHDGSIIPAFNDFRDQILLEFECRIYNNIKIQWNLNKLSLYDFKSGAFRSSDYSREEYNTMLSQFFSAWAGRYNLDYTTNDTYLSNNSFTWNYKKLSDRVFGELLQGSWRAIFDHFYDTTRPHTHPWEMLGFNVQPDWWEQRYGAAPYTSGNLVLWEDLRDGRIFYGNRAGVDARFARPDLLDIIPTDEYGQLRPPVEIFVKAFDSKKTKLSWAFGDIGPVEAAWRRSSEFAFANQAVCAIAKPAKYFGLYIDNDKYVYDEAIGEFTYEGENRRIQLSDYELNGETNDSGVISKASYVNWIIDKLNGYGVDGVSRVRSVIDATQVNLSYAMAGYSGLTLMNSFAEQASPNAVGKGILVPEDNQTITIKKSVPQARVTYSAVIVERTGTGFKVQGYDLARPYFTIIPSVANNNNYTIKVLESTATVYRDYDSIKTTIPYGTEFVNKQQLVDFLVSYNRYLVSQGIQFNEYDSELGDNRNFVLSAQEFLHWSQQGWGTQTVIVLNPLANKVSLARPGYIVDTINGMQAGASRVVDQNFNYLRNDQFNVVRIGNNFTINAINSNLALVEMSLVQYEHALIYDNTTIFKDIIYEPETGNRQQRIKIVGYKSQDWDGTLYAPGFIYNSDTVDQWQAGTDYKAGSLVEFKNQYYSALEDIAAQDTFPYNKWQPLDKSTIKTGLLPNFNNLAARIENYYDVSNANFESDIDLYSKGLIGFRPRSYLTDLGIDDISQIRFYQGYIKEKGTIRALDALLGAKFDRFTTEIDVYENWAVRVGEYGAIDSNQFVEVILPEESFAANPSFLELLNDGDVSDTGATGYSPNGMGDNKIVVVPKNYDKHLFLTTKDKINIETEVRSAGYVKLADVDGTIFDIENIAVQDPASFIQSIGSGYKLWVAKKANKDWTLLRADQTGVEVTNITNALDGSLAVTTSDRHNLQAGDYIAIKNFDPGFDFVYKVQSLASLKSFIIKANTDIIPDLTGFNSMDGTGVIYKFSTVRFDTIADWANYAPREGWQVGDVAAIDRWGSDYVDWAVFKKQDIWNLNQTVDSWDASSSQNYGGSVAFLNSGDYMLVGAPNEGTGKVFVYVRDSNGQYQELTAITQSDSGLSGFGTALTASDADYFAVGSPDSNTNTGYIHIFKLDTNLGTVSLVGSVKTGPSTSADFGRSISFSRDGLWLYVGAPGSNRVYVYGRSGTTFYQVGTYITPGDVATGDKFGYSVSCSTDGAQVLIGSPLHDTGATDSGAVYIYDRSIEAFIGDGSSAVFTVTRSPDTNIKLATVDDVTQAGVTYTGTGNKTVTFATAPGNGSLVKIHTNNFQLLKKLTPVSSQENQQFGYNLILCPYDCTAYVGAPQRDAANNAYNVGSVYRFTNMGRLYGQVTGTVTNPAVTAGHGIRINDFDVVFTSTTLAQVVLDINNTNIPGVTASNVSNKLQIVCDTVLVADKLRILPGSGTALTDLGLDVFVLTQTINNPNPTPGDEFGSVLAISSDAQKLAVGSTKDGTVEILTFDGGNTTFDINSLRLIDEIGQSGSVLVYEYVSERIDNTDRPGVFILDRYLEPGNLKLADSFGASIAMVDDMIAVGAPGVDKFGNNYGAAFVFKASDSLAWTVDGQAVAKVNTDTINRLYIYDTVTNTKLVDLDMIDPVKGKVPGQALAEIDFIAEVDPAIYGNTSSSKLEIWGNAQVGKVWWNTDRVRYIEYEQDDFQFRSNNWANTFPDSTIEVYEWTASTVLPSQYVATNSQNFNGYPAFDDSQIVEEVKIDPATGKDITTYYYWVRRKTTADANRGRNLTISAIEDLIANPKGQGLPYAALMADNTVGLFNVSTYLSGSDSILHIDYDVQPNVDVIHAEYDLVQENNGASRPAERILTKLIDSLAGQDAKGLEVPDTSLYGNLKYGVENRPRQSMFKDRQAALEVMLTAVNDIFDQYKLVEIYDTTKLNYAEPAPSKNSGEWEGSVANLTELSYVNTGLLSSGYNMLVESDSNYYNGWAIYTYNGSAWEIYRYQSYNLARFWTYVDYVKEGYDNTKIPALTVQNKYDLQRYTFNVGDTVKVMDNGTGRYEVVQYVLDSDNKYVFDTVALQNGTVNFTSELYTQSLINDGSTLSQTYSKEIRGLFDLLFNDLFVDELKQYVNELFFVVIRYLLREQKYADWLFKTSFIDIKHYFRKLEQQSVYLKDNQDFLYNYVSETKPYHTKIREYLLNYTGNEPWGGDTTDFDLPAYYDDQLNIFRSPSGEKSTDAYTLANDLQYRMWNLNYKYGVESIIIEDGGIDYYVAPTVKITAAEGDMGTGAEAYVLVGDGKIRDVIITDPGKDYVLTPTVEVITDSSLSSGSGAKLYAQLGNKTIRKIKTVMKFDRYTYDTAVLTWTANTYYLAGQYITYKNVLYRVDVADGSSAGFTSGATFDTDNLTKISDQDLAALKDGDFGSANDRIKAYYQPKLGMPGVDFAQVQSGIEYPGTKVDAQYFDDLPANYPTIASNLDDTIITSEFLDTDLGTRAEDILVDGDGFVSPYNSYAPEELMPGRIYDALNIQVHTTPRTDYNSLVRDWAAYTFYTNGTYVQYLGQLYQAVKDFVSVSSFSTFDSDGSTLALIERDALTQGAGPNITNFSSIADGVTATFDVAVMGTYDDVLFVYTKNRGLQEPNVDYVANYAQRTITFTNAPLANDIVFVSVQNHGGNYLLYDRIYKITETTEQLVLSTYNDLVKDILVFVNGERTFETTDWTHSIVDNLYAINFNTALVASDFVHVYVYSQSQTYREIHTTYRSFDTLPEVVYPTDYQITLDRVLKTSQPYHASIIVLVNNTRLRPPQNTYFLGDASTTVFAPSYVSDVDGAAVDGNDIEVFLNGTRQVYPIDYTLTPADGSTLRSVVFATAPSYDDKVVVSVTTNAEFSMISDSAILIDPSVTLSTISKVRVISYADHDTSMMRTTVYVGSTSSSLLITHGFDDIGFDAESAGFDSTDSVVVSLPRYALQYAHASIDYVMVYQNGVFLQPNVDFQIINSGTVVEIVGNVTATDVIVITEFTENSQRGMISFRIFKNLLDQVNYYSISLDDSTELTSDLGIFDTEMHVLNAASCPAPSTATSKPGVVFVNGERIAYWERDTVNNTISRLIRATGGTGAPNTHVAGTSVVSAGRNQEVTSIYDSSIVAKWKPNTLYSLDSYVLFEGKIYQVVDEFTSDEAFALTGDDGSTIALTERAQFRDTIWYDLNNETKSIVEVETTQARFLRQKVGFIPT